MILHDCHKHTNILYYTSVSPTCVLLQTPSKTGNLALFGFKHVSIDIYIYIIGASRGRSRNTILLNYIKSLTENIAEIMLFWGIMPHTNHNSNDVTVRSFWMSYIPYVSIAIIVVVPIVAGNGWSMGWFTIGSTTFL